MRISDSDKLQSIIRHVKRVEDNCNIISIKLMETNPYFALKIAKRGRLHDASKFGQIEFDHLWPDNNCFEVALLHHHSNNSHHPEYYANSIYGFCELDLAEFVADCAARAQEFGVDARIWLLDKAAKKYGYENDEKLLFKIENYLNMILNKPFI